MVYLYFLGQDIHLSDFPEKHPKNADLFFSSENGGGVKRIFFSIFFLSILDRPKTIQNQLNLRNLPPLVTPYPTPSYWPGKIKKKIFLRLPLYPY